MILADSTAWVDHFRGAVQGGRLVELIRAGSDVACTEPVLMEVLAGARSAEEYADVRDTLLGVGWIPIDAAADFEAAARIYSMSRAAGVMPGGLIDCLIAAIALRVDATLLTSDKDLHRLASVVPLAFAE